MPEHRFETALEMNKALSEFVRRSGMIIRREDVATRMQDYFGEARESMARTVQMYMATRASDTAPPSVPTVPTSLRPTPSEPVGPSSGVRQMPPLPPPSRSWGLPIAGVAVAMAVVGGGGYFLARPRLAAKPAAAVHTAAPQEAAPNAAAVATATAARGEAEQVCHLTLSSDPLEAQVEWGGNVIGQTPMLIDLLPGPQTFVLSRDGYFKATVVLNITESMSGKPESRTVVMIPRKGKGGALATTGARAGLKGALANAIAASPSTPDPNGAAAAEPASDPGAPPEAPPAATSLAKSTPAGGFNTADNPPVPKTGMPTPGPAATASLPSVLPFGPEMTRPALISGGELSYPREAIVAGVSGTIIAKCTITAEGSLRNCRIIKGLPFLDKAALDVLATRRYSPVLYQGKAVPVEYVFNLKVAPPR
jgi:TonB family protein